MQGEPGNKATKSLLQIFKSILATNSFEKGGWAYFRGVGLFSRDYSIMKIGPLPENKPTYPPFSNEVVAKGAFLSRVCPPNYVAAIMLSKVAYWLKH